MIHPYYTDKYFDGKDGDTDTMKNLKKHHDM